jgi:phenylalanyl-tRNA synthetase beta subunit (EC 6.1.1.20)
MKFSLSWLKTHLATEASLSRITEALNNIGLEVEGVEDRAAALAPFVIARVIEATPTPMPTACGSAGSIPVRARSRWSAVPPMRAPA